MSTERRRLEGAPFGIFLLLAFVLAAALTRLAGHASETFDGGVHVADVPYDVGAPLALALAVALAVALAAMYLRLGWAWLFCAVLAVALMAVAIAYGEIPLVSPIVLVLCFRPSVRRGRPR